MSNEYYYARGGQRFGPMTAKQLKDLGATGQLLPTDVILGGALTDWTPADRIKGLVQAPIQVSPVAPPAIPPEAPSVAGVTFPPDTGSLLPHAETAAKQAKEAAVTASRDALQAFKILIKNPVGGLQDAFESLGSSRAVAAGVAFGVVFDLCVLIGAFLMATRLALLLAGDIPPEVMMSPRFQESVSRHPSLSAMFKYVFLGFVPLISFTGGCAIVRTVFRGQRGIQSDVFIAGASLLPLGAWVVVSGLLGIGNTEVIGALFIFAVTTTILMLYSGCTTLQRIPVQAATVAVPVIILATVYIAKVILAALA